MVFFDLNVCLYILVLAVLDTNDGPEAIEHTHQS